nr:Vms1/Ankzf1 family peptidyl-tRNA hydrolase [Kineococcus siccus]
MTWLKDVATDPGPHVSVYVDVSRDTENGAHEIAVRWQDARQRLQAQGAPAPAIEALDGLAGQTVGAPGRVGRALVAGPGGLELDVLLPEPPLREEAVTGPVPHLMPLVRALADDVRYVLVVLDRTGADITSTRSAARALGQEETRTVQGDHDLIHKVRGGGWAHLRYQHAVQDSWDHNAQAVAEDLDGLVRREQPEVVLLAGETKAVAALKAKASHVVLEHLVDIPGGRGDGTNEEAFEQGVAQALDVVRRERCAAVLAEFGQEIGRMRTGQGPDRSGGAGRAVEGLAAVVDALRRSQVQTLLLHDDPTSTEELWACADPLLIGTSPDELRALGVEEPVRARADAVLVRALAATDAGIQLVDDEVTLQGGVGAVLRYADPSTGG